jgi:hypothetical protein
LKLILKNSGHYNYIGTVKQKDGKESEEQEHIIFSVLAVPENGKFKAMRTNKRVCTSLNLINKTLQLRNCWNTE